MRREDYHLPMLYCESCGARDGETYGQKRMRSEHTILYGADWTEEEITELEAHRFDVRPTERGVFCFDCGHASDPRRNFSYLTGRSLVVRGLPV